MVLKASTNGLSVPNIRIQESPNSQGDDQVYGQGETEKFRTLQIPDVGSTSISNFGAPSSIRREFTTKQDNDLR